MNLYEVSARYQQLLDKEEYTTEEMQELESLHGSLEESCINRGKYIRNLEGEAEMVDKAIHHMQERSTALWNKAERQRERLALLMRSNNIDRIKSSPLFSLRVKENPVSVDDFDTSAIPVGYWVEITPNPVRRIDKTAIRDAIESGKDVPGARLVRKLKIEFK